MPETKYIDYNFQMRPENIAYLEQHAQHGVNARNDTFRNLGAEVRDRFYRIIDEEFQPGYSEDMTCDKCVLRMVKLVFVYYQQWKDAQQPKIINT